MTESEIVLVVGGGGRESALVDKYAQSADVREIIAVPGNDLMQANTKKRVRTFPTVETTNVEAIQTIIEREGVSLVDVAQDNAVEVGVADKVREMGVAVIGPDRLAGQIEDKAWSREFGQRHNLSQPSFKICSSYEEGQEFIRNQPEGKWFVKAAGLAEGKGAKPAHNNEEVLERIKQIKKEYPNQSRQYLIEKWIEGEEFSAFAVGDGKNWKILGSAQDHKRALDGDLGENTGGMGAVSPPLLVTSEINQSLGNMIFNPLLQGLNEESRSYKGVVYLGGMVSEGFKTRTNEQGIVVVEFNARWGDPEAQVIVPGLVGDLYDLGLSVAAGDISKIDIHQDGKVRVAVAGTSLGYPGDYSSVRGREIKGLDQVLRMEGARLYGAGVRRVDGKDYADGGRLFYIVGEGLTVIEARERAYEAMAVVSVDGDNLHFRTDIGFRDVARLK